MFRTISKKMMVAAVAAMMLVTMHAGVARAGDDDARFEGTIESLPASGLVGDWVVAGQTVHVTSGTEIDQDDGPAVVGARVEVRGEYESDGSVTADEIEVERAGDDNGGGDDGPNDDEIHGVVESLPASGLIGDWVVSGRVVHVSASTSIEQEHGAVAVGASVEVHGVPQSDGSLDATRIEVNPTGGNGGGGSPNGGHAKFFGTVESLPSSGLVGLWMVSSRAVHVTSSTVVEREHNVTPVVGSYVEVEGSQLQDGSIQASKVEVKTGSGGNDDNGGSTPGSGSSSSGGYAEIRATVDALPANGMVGEWTVGGRTVFVTEATRIKQKRNRPIAAGSTVEVRGNQRADGSIDANRIEAKSARGGGRGTSSFYGTIEALPVSGLVGEWVVAGRAVVVAEQTFVDQEHGQARLGALVEVKGSSQADGSFLATKVEIKDGSGTVGSSGYIEFYGTVESLPASGLVGEWMVSGRRVFVTAGTTIREKHGPVRVGIRVEIEGNQRSDGSVDARKVGTED
jgi:hypothetical protein